MVNRVDATETTMALLELNEPELQGSYLEEESSLESSFLPVSDQVNFSSQSRAEDNENAEVVYRRMSDTPRNPVTGEVLEDELIYDKKRAARKKSNLLQMQAQLRTLESQTSMSEDDKILAANLRNHIAEARSQLSNFSSGAS